MMKAHTTGKTTEATVTGNSQARPRYFAKSWLAIESPKITKLVHKKAFCSQLGGGHIGWKNFGKPIRRRIAVFDAR
jgi:hypothetical protein